MTVRLSGQLHGLESDGGRQENDLIRKPAGVELRDRYEVKSNRESGYGRYDVILIPLSESDDAIILEFKVHDPLEEKDLEETVDAALAQIKKKKYDTELTEKGFTQNRIRRYGFAFEGKKVLIGGK